jgi:catalase
MAKKTLTSAFGAPISNDLNSVTAGPRGEVNAMYDDAANNI